MRRTITLMLVLGAVLAAEAVSGPALVAVDDGILLEAGYGAFSGSVRLTWSGAPPNYGVYRATSPVMLAEPVNQVVFTGFTSWEEEDAPPGTFILYYQVASSCAPSPIEICDGFDNNCDGATDEPGSEISCTIPNATARCALGICGIGSCNSGWGDCDGAVSDGCEVPLNVAQSTSPAAYGGPLGDQDLRPGYARVPSVANCGGCGVSCGDGIPCTTDLCVPSAAGPAQCRHYDRAQCAGARCPQASLPPGTPPPTEPACAGLDADNDGLPQQWEQGGIDPYTGQPRSPGIDLNCDGVISNADNDLIWHEAPSGDGAKDVYLEIDYMAPAPGEPESHAPSAAAISEVVQSFAAAGVSLHVDPNQQALPHAAVVYLPVTDPLDACAAIPGAVSLHDSVYKGNPGVFDQRRRLGYRYMLFAHDTSCEPPPMGGKTSGIAEIGGNDAIVSLGSFDYVGRPAEVDAKRARESAGTMMHELGHNLGLCHNGPGCDSPADPNGSGVQKRPNYISTMNYSHQLNGILRSALPGEVFPPDPITPRRFDFSHETLPALDETFLDEFAGVGAPEEPFSRDIAWRHCPEKSPGPSQGPIDWNCDSAFEPGVAADVNADGQLTTLLGASDWNNLSFDFQCRPTLEDGAQEPSRVARQELTLEQAVREGLRAGPLLCPPGLSDCDGDDTNGCETLGPCLPAAIGSREPR